MQLGNDAQPTAVIKFERAGTRTLKLMLEDDAVLAMYEGSCLAKYKSVTAAC